jgi:hypothetical protein
LCDVSQVARRDTFVAMGDKGAMFRSSERQQIIDYIIRSKIKDGMYCSLLCVCRGGFPLLFCFASSIPQEHTCRETGIVIGLFL